MTSPIETAAEKIRFTLLDTLGGCNLNVPPVAAKAAFESIDIQELATVIGDNLTARNADGFIVVGNSAHLALAVKNWLTGKDTQ